uniref:RNase_Zc3h12a domain-containing protein n=1 Tax=Anopheles dirus TaxID=7168 RepID=A0A182NHI2_9DIPT
MASKKRPAKQGTPNKRQKNNKMKAKNRIQEHAPDAHYLAFLNRLGKPAAVSNKKMKGHEGPLKMQLRSMPSPSTSKTGKRSNVNINASSLTKRSPTSTVTNDQNGNVPKTATDTIVIDDSDDERVNSQQPLFYLDVKPGVRDEDVPLYNTLETGTVERAAPIVVRPESPKRPLSIAEDSIIVLDNTLDQTVNTSLKNMQIHVEEQAVRQPSPLSSISSNSIASTPSSSAEKQRNQTTSPITIVSDVIDLDDYPDTAPSSSTNTPAFPVQDCIPIGYDVLQPRGIESNRSPKQPNKSNGGVKNGATINTAKSKSSPMPQAPEPKKRMVIIDGNNVAYGHLNGKMFSVKGLELCIRYFKKLGHEVVAVVPQYKLKKHQSTDYVLLDKLHRQGDVTLAPSKNLPGQCSSTYDDRLILSVAEQFDGVIISNDNFRDLLDISPAWRRIIETRVIGYTWVKDCFFLPDDPYGRHGPSLQQMLNGQSV